MNDINKSYYLDWKTVQAYNHIRKFLKRQLICYAPSRSMRFSLTGNILACCFNRYFSLGKYPDNNIHEIWFGEKKIALCKSIQENDFSKGCQVCYNNIYSKNFYSVGALQYDYLSKTKKGYPTMLDFEIGNTCNLECIMCNGENSASIRQNREGKMPHQIVYDIEFIDQLDEFIPFLSEARFVGGEPFLTELHYLIWEKIIRIKPSINISVLTNATVLNDRVKQIITNGNFSISVSIDSLVKETYESIRINAEFEKVMENIAYFQEYTAKKKKSFYINICPMRQNRFEIPDMVKYCNNNNIFIIFHTVVFPAHCALWKMNSSEIAETISFYKKHKLSVRNSMQNKNTVTFISLIQQLEKWREKAEIREASYFLKNYEDLKNELFQKLDLYLTKINADNNKIKKIKIQIESIINDINNKQVLNKALLTLNMIEPEQIIAEFEISDYSMLYERFLSLGQ